jgi:metal-responsive CopG/Arc/MetJ family transcriptional regulator
MNNTTQNIIDWEKEFDELWDENINENGSDCIRDFIRNLISQCQGEICVSRETYEKAIELAQKEAREGVVEAMRKRVKELDNKYHAGYYCLLETDFDDLLTTLKGNHE